MLSDSREIIKPPEDIIVEVGPGSKPGRNALDLSEDIKSRLQKGALYIAVDADRGNLEQVSHGAVAHMSLQDFALSKQFLAGKARTIVIGNVISARGPRLSSTEMVKTILAIAQTKLTPDGSIIIIENLAPDRSAFLKTIPYGDFGLAATISEGTRYQQKLAELKMKESPAAEETLWRTGSPFILELKLQKSGE